MCLIALALGAHPRWPLVIASNRDEFRSRPAAPLAEWTADNGQPVLAGRDLRDGGTWLGVTPAGRVAMLTNVRRGEPQRGVRSRGELPMRWLAG
ncbi:MAG: NRDE family protein, partial [Pseudomonadota bacterium]